MEQILVVDDDPGVRKLLMHLLTKARYEAIEASDGMEALEILQADSTDIVLVISDVDMPRMNGIRLAKEAQRIREIKFILLSGEPLKGRSESDQTAVFLLQREPAVIVAYASKPIRREELINIVRKAIPHETGNTTSQASLDAKTEKSSETQGDD